MAHDPIYILGERLKLLQPAEGFRTSIDAVLLAAACPVREGQSVLDLGCGVGTAGLCVAARVPGVHLTGVDIQGDHIEIARENAALNNVTADFEVHDIRLSYAKRFDHVICNPPYMEVGSSIVSPSQAKAVAKGEAVLEDWVKAAHALVKSKGSFTLVHRADYTDRIIRALGKKFGAVEIIPLWPKAGRQAKRVIIRCVKDSKSPAVLHAGLVLHKDEEGYTPEAEAVLRGGAGLLV